MKITVLLPVILLFTISLKSQWQRVTHEFIYSISLNSNGMYVFSANKTEGLIKSGDDGLTWMPADNGILPSDPSNHESLVVNGNNVFISVRHWSGPYEDGVYLSTDNGDTWAPVNNGFPVNIRIGPLSIMGNSIFAGTDNGIYLSTDNGNAWTYANYGIPANTEIASFANDGSRIYAGTFQRGIYRSSNNGINWVAVNTGIGFNSTVRELVISGSTIYAVVNNNKLYTSNDIGNHWALASTLTGDTFMTLFPYFSALFAGTLQGKALLSLDNGYTWADVSDSLNIDGGGLHTFTVQNNYIFAGVDCSAVWRRPLAEMLGVGDNFFSKTSKVFPNPSDGCFNVISDSQLKSVTIQNILGEVVYSQNFNKYQTKTGINLTGIPRGIYFIMIDNGKFTGMEKVIVR